MLSSKLGQKWDPSAVLMKGGRENTFSHLSSEPKITHCSLSNPTEAHTCSVRSNGLGMWRAKMSYWVWHKHTQGSQQPSYAIGLGEDCVCCLEHTLNKQIIAISSIICGDSYSLKFANNCWQLKLLTEVKCSIVWIDLLSKCSDGSFIFSGSSIPAVR